MVSAECIPRRLGSAVPGEAALQPEPQQRPIDRRAYLNDVQTSDDSRRVPAPPGPRGPEGTTVLRGGLVFDGTGSEPAAGTVVMERNRIAAVHGPSLQRQDSQSTGLTATPRPHRPARTESHMISVPVARKLQGSSPPSLGGCWIWQMGSIWFSPDPGQCDRGGGESAREHPGDGGRAVRGTRREGGEGRVGGRER